MTIHWQILGGSGTGKSRYMKQICIPMHRARGRRVAVLDPICQPGWNADFVTDKPDVFINGVMQLRSGWVLVIDEWPHLMEFYDWKEMRKLIWCYTIGRNFGHLSYAIGQTPMWIPKPVRRQCMNGVFFRQDVSDCEENAKTLQCDGMRLCSTFRKGEALIIRDGYAPTRSVIFPDLAAKDPGMVVKIRGGPAVPSR